MEHFFIGQPARRFRCFQRADDAPGQDLVRVPDFLGQRAVIHIDVFDLVGVAAGKPVQFLGDGADGGDHEVVGEHGRDGHEQAGDRGHQRGGHAGRHGGERGGLAFGDAGKGGHDAPDRAQQSDERSARHRRGQHNHALFQRHRLPAGGFFQNHLHRLKRRHADFDRGGLAENRCCMFPAFAGFGNGWTAPDCFSIDTPVRPRRGCKAGRRARRRIPRPCAGCPAGRAWSCRRQRIFWSPAARSATGGTW